MEIEENSVVKVYMKFDEGDYEKAYSIYAKHRKTCTIPIIPRRCSMFKMKIEGRGQVKIFGIAKYVEMGTEI